MLPPSQTLSNRGGSLLAEAGRVLAPTGRFLVRYRVRLSVAVFGLLVAIDVLLGFRPRDLADPYDVRAMLGLGLVLAGLALRSWAAGVLRKLDQLATEGPYQLIRHPLYVGSLAIMLGICLIINDYANYCVVPMFVLFVYSSQIRSEERLLAQRFPNDWPAYAGRTGRFLPRRLWANLSATWRLKQWLKNREYNALGAALAGLVALKLWAGW